ncbi:MAG: ABC transporter ATP-binding protein, partial [Candidatus Hermodarchaeota archaeon]
NSNLPKENESIDENNVIETFDLTKRYKIRGKTKEITALNRINLKVKEGEIFGLLGPNGAGKTTLVSILTALIQPSEGYAKILGRNVLKERYFIKKNVGLMLGSEMIYYRLTGYRNLKFFSKIYNISGYEKKIKDITEMLGLTSKLNQLVETYSSGMKVKLALARVLLINPKILFLDEPMLGLDPIIVQEIINILKNLKKTIFITSHQMNIVESLCSKIAFLNQGNIIKTDTKENFSKFLQKEIRIQIKIDLNRVIELIDELNNLNYISDIEKDNDLIFFNIQDRNCYLKIFGILQKYPITQIKELETRLEDIFIKLNA